MKELKTDQAVKIQVEEKWVTAIVIKQLDTSFNKKEQYWLKTLNTVEVRERKDIKTIQKEKQ